MKSLFSILVVLALVAGNANASRLELAEQKARTEHKLILLNFSGSDWCGPCIRMTKEVLESDGFQKYLNANLLFINADFPRLKKHQLQEDLKKENEELAEKYNADGTFPCTLLIDSSGKVIAKWKGFYAQGAEAFTSEVSHWVDKNR